MNGVELCARWREPSRAAELARIHRGELPNALRDAAGVLDLRGADLRGAIFDSMQLARARFELAQLDGASFVDSELAGADFTSARCRGVRADRARLHGVVFDRANAYGSSFVRADLGGASLVGSSFGNADLRAAQLRDVRWIGCDLEGAMLFGASIDRDVKRSGGARRHAAESGYPTFADAIPLYMDLLGLRGTLAVRALEGCAWGAKNLAAELAALLGSDNWRTVLIGASTLVFAPPPRERDRGALVERIWSELAASTWISPQLAAIAQLLDERFETRAAQLLESGLDEKAHSALAALLARSQGSGTGAKIAATWGARARLLAGEDVRAFWVAE